MGERVFNKSKQRHLFSNQHGKLTCFCGCRGLKRLLNCYRIISLGPALTVQYFIRKKQQKNSMSAADIAAQMAALGLDVRVVRSFSGNFNTNNVAFLGEKIKAAFAD